MRYILEEIGYDKIFFGSDYPTDDIDAQIADMKGLVSAAHHPAVFGGNVRRFGVQFGWWEK